VRATAACGFVVMQRRARLLVELWKRKGLAGQQILKKLNI